jgi:plastocyanin
MAWKHLLPLALMAATVSLMASPAAAQTTLSVTAKDSGCTGTTFCFEPAALTATGGSQVTVTLNNAGAATHSLCFRTAPEACTPNPESGTPASASSTVTVTTPASGTVAYYCKVAGHEGLGMRGNLTVSGAAPPSPPPTSPPTSPPPQSTPSLGVVSIVAGVALLAVALRRR